ncbi:hypothetical protein GC169_06220 [bacterium]|nr:hypothetical protein [bacterium]
MTPPGDPKALASSITVYGLKSCDACRKALSALRAAGRDPAFVDLRELDDLVSLAPDWLREVGRETLVNRRSTTWRSLSPSEQGEADDDAGALTLILRKPELIKRPVIVANDRVTVGLDAERLKSLSA